MDAEEWEALGDLRNYQSKLDKDKSLLICECKAVSLQDIQNFISKKEMKSLDFDQLKQALGLGSGCSTCVKNKDEWVKLLRFK